MHADATMQHTMWLGSMPLMNADMLAAQDCTESAQPVQRGSFIRSHAMIVGSFL